MDHLKSKSDDYLVLKCIGKGTYGTVLLCKRISDQSTVVLKEVPVNTTATEKFQEAQNEIKVLSTLSHPFIVKYHESFEENGSVYICMEYATGGNLAEYMLQKCHSLLPQKEILYFFCQILLGVQYIHEKKIIHRDLKAENILLSGQCGTTVKLGDFGIAKILDKDKASTVIGTPYYLAPELCESQPYDYKTDIWAMGCLLYEMCTHRRAFDSPTLVGLVNRIVSGSFIPIDVSFYGPQLQKIIERMLVVAPENRCSAADLTKTKVLRETIKFLQICMQAEIAKTLWDADYERCMSVIGK